MSGRRRGRIAATGGTFAVVVVLLVAALVQPRTANAADACSRSAAVGAMNDQLLPYADAHAPEVFEQFGGAAELDYGVGRWLCRDLTRDGDREMIVHAQCCTGGSPSPWGIFVHNPAGAWKLAYARAADTVFVLRLVHRTVRATMPAPYEGACTRFVRVRTVRWSGSRFRSSL